MRARVRQPAGIVREPGATPHAHFDVGRSRRRFLLMKRPFRVTKGVRESEPSRPDDGHGTPPVTFVARVDLFGFTDGRSVKNTYRRSPRVRTMNSQGRTLVRPPVDELARRRGV